MIMDKDLKIFLNSDVFSKRVEEIIDAKTNESVSVAIELLDKRCEPIMGSDEAACYDVFARLSEPMKIDPYQSVLIPLGVKFGIPSGYRIDLRARSSIRKMKAILNNSVGIIDSDYTGELMVSLQSLSGTTIIINPYDKIGQINLSKVIPVNFNQVNLISEVKVTKRGKGGFGSTGNK